MNLCTLFLFTNNYHTKSTFFLAACLFAHALILINELIMWGAEFKTIVERSRSAAKGRSLNHKR